MTVEKALEILEHNWTGINNPDYTEKELCEVLELAIEALEQTRWIPVIEELPKIGKYVLVYINPVIENRHPIIISSRDKGKEKYWTDGTILAWMPLPQPYKAEPQESEEV